jgi:segregation and condensation protein A
MGLLTGPPIFGGPVAPALGLVPARFQFSLPGFEGPLDLLLRLTEREKLDITTVSLVQVTGQYLEHLRSQVDTDAVALADFVAIGSRLLLLKSRSLLPRTAPIGPTEVDDEDELVDAIREYALYRAAAASIDGRAVAVGRLYPRIAVERTQIDLPLRKVPVEQLALLVQDVLSRIDNPEPSVALPRQVISVAEKCEQMLSLLRAAPLVSFFRLIETCNSRLEVVVCFFAVLHLIRDGKLVASQPEPFSEIVLRLPSLPELEPLDEP